MQNLEPITETKHEELLSLLNPLIDFMIANNYSYFLVAGKDGTCTRHLRGEFDDVAGIITGLMENNKQVRAIIESSVNDLK
ncbi:MAG: hypothetical protein IPJ81_18150 [Chitinophagaceae bacterium]|nr:hypothetical protein [Chitinophagaceae bacterium]